MASVATAQEVRGESTLSNGTLRTIQKKGGRQGFKGPSHRRVKPYSRGGCMIEKKVRKLGGDGRGGHGSDFGTQKEGSHFFGAAYL